jgi:hypothetical protein
MKTWSSALAAATTLVASSAWAMPYFELGDAGQSLTDAQAVGAGVDVIHGTVGLNTADLFSFRWGGGAFTVDTFGSIADTQLFLFNAAGQGVWANDQAGGTNASQIIDPSLAAGQYFIGISVFDYDPFSSAGAMFPSAPFNGQFGPLNAAPLDHWATFSGHGSGGGDYVINFSAPTAVPEPPMLAVFGIALAALGLARRLRKA